MKMENNFYQRAINGKSSMMKFLAVMLCSAFLFSCDHMKDVDEVVDDIKEEQKARTFKAKLSPLNNSGVTGEAVFHYMENGMFKSHISAMNLVPNMVHPQHIHGFGFENENPQNAVCPPESAAGDDGLLVLEDGLPFYGPILIPLDSELVPLSVDEFPMANDNGQQNYLEFTKLSNLVHAINMAHNGEQTRKNISLTKRTVVLHGAFVKDNRIVPEGTEGAEYVATLPVACGEIEEVF